MPYLFFLEVEAPKPRRPERTRSTRIAASILLLPEYDIACSLENPDFSNQAAALISEIGVSTVWQRRPSVGRQSAEITWHTVAEQKRRITNERGSVEMILVQFCPRVWARRIPLPTVRDFVPAVDRRNTGTEARSTEKPVTLGRRVWYVSRNITKQSPPEMLSIEAKSLPLRGPTRGVFRSVFGRISWHGRRPENFRHKRDGQRVRGSVSVPLSAWPPC